MRRLSFTLQDDPPGPSNRTEQRARPSDDFYLNGFLNSFRERNTLHRESSRKRFLKTRESWGRQRAERAGVDCARVCICSSVCTGCLPTFEIEGDWRESEGSVKGQRKAWVQGYAYSEIFNFEAGATKYTWCMILVLKGCSANFKEPPRKRRERFDATQAAAKGKLASAKAS